ncbi:MAG: hypothetical protein AAF808_03520 [Cyanobacteria bacterium P01_D01_bin.2]
MNLLEEMERLTAALEGARQLAPEADTALHDELTRLATATRGCAENLATAIALPCRTCGYYFGEAHGPNTLVCALHPSGPEGDTCPDWEENSQC